MAEGYQTLVIACITGLVSSVVTITSMRVDIVWLKKNCNELKNRVNSIEESISQLKN